MTTLCTTRQETLDLAGYMRDGNAGALAVLAHDLGWRVSSTGKKNGVLLSTPSRGQTLAIPGNTSVSENAWAGWLRKIKRYADRGKLAGFNAAHFVNSDKLLDKEHQRLVIDAFVSQNAKAAAGRNQESPWSNRAVPQARPIDVLDKAAGITPPLPTPEKTYATTAKPGIVSVYLDGKFVGYACADCHEEFDLTQDVIDHYASHAASPPAPTPTRTPRATKRIISHKVCADEVYRRMTTSKMKRDGAGYTWPFIKGQLLRSRSVSDDTLQTALDKLVLEGKLEYHHQVGRKPAYWTPVVTVPAEPAPEFLRSTRPVMTRAIRVSEIVHTMSDADKLKFIRSVVAPTDPDHVLVSKDLLPKYQADIHALNSTNDSLVEKCQQYSSDNAALRAQIEAKDAEIARLTERLHHWECILELVKEGEVH